MRKQISLTGGGLSRKKPLKGSRDHHGRFLPGNSIGKNGGRPPGRREMDEAFRSAISEADVVALAKKLLKLAKGGDIRALREILDRVLGKAKDPNRLFFEEDYSDYDPSEEFL